MDLVTHQGLKFGPASGEHQVSEATVVVNSPPGGPVRAVLHADPQLVIAFVAVVALAVAGMALCVVHRAIGKLK
jgi:hypothetical protein